MNVKRLFNKFPGIRKFFEIQLRGIHLAFAILLMLFIVLAITSAWAFWCLAKKPPMPAPGPDMQLVIQKPEPSHIERIERPASNTEMAEAEYQAAMTNLHQGTAGETFSYERMGIAIRSLKRVLARMPVYPPAREALTALLIKQGNLIEAGRVVDIGVLQDPSYLPYLKLKLHILVKQGNNEQAIALLQKIPPAMLESDMDYMSMVVPIYLQQGQYAQAVQGYRELLQTNPSNPLWLMGLGMGLEGLGKTQEALQSYQAAQRSATPQLGERISERIKALQ